MTNKEIIQASLLDILFDGRNKDYGAYVLRRDYNHRLLLSLGLGLSLTVLFLLLNDFQKEASLASVSHPAKDSIRLIAVDIPAAPRPPEKKAPSSLPAAPKAPRPEATLQFVTPRIVEEITNTAVPAMTEIDKNVIGSENREGSVQGGAVPVEPPGSGAGDGSWPAAASPEPPGPSSAPRFPGGFAALREFLARNIVTPGDLAVGEKKMVRARFFVDKDGSVSTIEIEMSGGKAFDREVIRVCRRMPKWKPGLQNGIPVRTSYLLPVTFIGED